MTVGGDDGTELTEWVPLIGALPQQPVTLAMHTLLTQEAAGLQQPLVAEHP